MDIKPICRLCYNEMHTCTDIQNYIEIYGDVGRLYECEKKITNFLYLDIAESDVYSKKLCLICLQHLETFYKFYEKVNEIQKKYLNKEQYNAMALKGILVRHEVEDVKQNSVEEVEDYVEVKNETIELVEIAAEDRLASNNNIPASTDNPKRRKGRIKKKLEKPPEFEDDAEEEGESGNEFPAPDSENDDWPAQTKRDKYPQMIIRDGVLTMKGKRLMEIISRFYKLECDICESDRPRFKFLKQLFTHYQEVHQTEGHVSCCQTKLVRYPSIIMHMARHIQPDAFKCDICGYMVTRPRFLESHRQTHLPESEKPFGCDQCPRRFCWKGALQFHKISHHSEGERKLYICHVCGKIYETPGGLSMHKNRTHSNKIKIEESHVCHVCAKSFTTRTNLKEHMSTHEPREKGQIQCTECGKWLMNNRCLKSHMILHSTVVHSCQMCEYKTKKKVLLQRHLLTQHSNEKPFECATCGKKFKLKRALTVHLAKHTDKAKTYKCQFCDREFMFSTNYYTHRKIKHPAELQQMKQLEVEEKRKRRIAAGIEPDIELDMALPDHLAKQTDTPKTYKCQFCDREFMFSTNFYTHRKLKHSAELQQMKEREVEEKRKRKIIAGIEPDSQLDMVPDDFDEFIETEDLDLELMKHEL